MQSVQGKIYPELAILGLLLGCDAKEARPGMQSDHTCTFVLGFSQSCRWIIQPNTIRSFCL